MGESYILPVFIKKKKFPSYFKETKRLKRRNQPTERYADSTKLIWYRKRPYKEIWNVQKFVLPFAYHKSSTRLSSFIIHSGPEVTNPLSNFIY